MTYAAQIVEGVVVQVVCVPNLQWVRDNLTGEWIECKRDGSIRGCYPGPGYAYDRENDVFVPPQEESEI
jgi:hypothetical protein